MATKNVKISSFYLLASHLFGEPWHLNLDTSKRFFFNATISSFRRDSLQPSYNGQFMYDIRFQRALFSHYFSLLYTILQLDGVVTIPHTIRSTFISVKSLQNDNS